MEYTKTLPKYAKSDINFLNGIFELYPEGIVLKDSDLKYISVNRSYLSLFSIKDDILLLNKQENSFLSDKNIKLINDADTEVKNYIRSISYVINTEAGKILNITTSPILNNNVFIGILSCVRDITQEEIIKEKFVNKHFKYIDAEKQLQAQRETFVASVGHDLKNPTIAQIRGLELLLKGTFGTLNKEQEELLCMILDSCRYMNGMLSSLLDTYRNYGGAIKLNFSEFSLLDLVNECVLEMQYVARDKDIDININSAYHENICADRIQIRRVIMNLLTNAIKYAYKNTELKLFIYQEANCVKFEFENHSPYIPEEKQKSIFARYVSYAEAHKELGIGLGLYASKKIIESHCGKIYVKSYKDNRNKFGFLIPINLSPKALTKIYL